MAKKAQAQAGDLSRLEMSFDKPHLINAVFGEFDRNLVTIENRLGVYISARGNRVQIEGEAGAIGRTRDVLNDIYSRLSRGQEIDAEAVQSIIAMTADPTLEGIVRKDAIRHTNSVYGGIGPRRNYLRPWASRHRQNIFGGGTGCGHVDYGRCAAAYSFASRG
jgi:phosphate starvation-inducible protein PhoH